LDASVNVFVSVAVKLYLIAIDAYAQPNLLAIDAPSNFILYVTVLAAPSTARLG
jgi:hypothetical protein